MCGLGHICKGHCLRRPEAGRAWKSGGVFKGQQSKFYCLSWVLLLNSFLAFNIYLSNLYTLGFETGGTRVTSAPCQSCMRRKVKIHIWMFKEFSVEAGGFEQLRDLLRKWGSLHRMWTLILF